MQSLRTLIIDDEPIALEKLHTYAGRIPFLEPVGACRNGIEAIDFMASNEVDLIISDINMPDLDGMEFIKTLPNPPMVIFITAYPQYAVESYKVSAVDYLLKPYGFAEFSHAVNKARELFDSRAALRPAATDGSLFIKVDYRYVRVAPADIRFIKGYGEYLQIYVAGMDSPLLTLSSFAAIRERLTGDFLQIHRSYIVNMNHVAQIERNRLAMDAETYIPIGDSYKATFQQYLASHAVGKTSK